MVQSETLTNDEAVAFWSLLHRVTGNQEAFELLWQDVDVEQKKKSLEALVSLRVKMTGLMITQTDFDLHVERRIEQ